jgi:peptidoglycan hydrolase-like protein with peptidoglycan-binding domain
MRNLTANGSILILVMVCLISGVTRTALGVQSQIQVRQVQERLKAGGFDPGPIDGTLGPRTKEALRQHQAKYGLPETGVLDDATLDAHWNTTRGK